MNTFQQKYILKNSGSRVKGNWHFNLTDLIWYAVITSLLTINFLPGGNIIVNLFIILFSSILLIKIARKGQFIWAKPLSALFLFSTFSFITYFYSLIPELALMRSFTMIQLTVFAIFMFNYLQSRLSVERTLNVIELSGILLFLILLISGNLFSGERASNTLGDVNTIGIYLSLVTSISLWKFLYKRKSSSLLIFLLLSLVVLLTGSRSALLVLLTVILTLIISKIRGPLIKKIIYMIGISILIAPIVYYLIFEIPFLYEVIGIRVESMIDIFSGRSSSIQERSVQNRTYFLIYGLELFMHKPIFGWGVESFRQLVGEMTGFYTFSHNNYVELLANTGLVGFILYYSIFIYIYFNLYRLLKTLPLKERKKDNDFYILSLSIVNGMLVSNFFLVLYYQKAEILFLFLIVSILKLRTKIR